MNFMYILSILIDLTLIAILLIGLIQSKRHSFKPGFYFFLIMLIQELYSSVSVKLIEFVASNDILPFEISLGQLTHLSLLINRLLGLLAVVILVIGLLKLWRRNRFTIK